MIIPDEIAKTQNKNADASELDSFWERAFEGFHESGKHRCQCKRAEALSKGDHGGGSNACCFPRRAPIEWIVGVVAGLGDQNCFAGALHEVMRPDVCHDLRSWQDFGMELSLQLVELLFTCQPISPFFSCH